MKTISFRYDTVLTFDRPVTEHTFLLRCIPVSRPEQTVTQMVHSVVPAVIGGAYSTDGFGNVVYTGRIPSRHERFEYTVEGRVLRNDVARVKEGYLPCYLYPSALTQSCREIDGFLAGVAPAGTAREKALTAACELHKYLTYESGSSTVDTTAAEAFRQQKGVCQDFAHVMLAMCRRMEIPARYVSGLAAGEGETHAWVEIWQDGLWYGMDPTAGRETDESYIKLCVGRDYSDCPLERGIFSGLAVQTQKVTAKVTEE